MILTSVLRLYIPEFKYRTTRALLENVRKRCCWPVFSEVCQGFVFVSLWPWKGWRQNIWASYISLSGCWAGLCGNVLSGDILKSFSDDVYPSSCMLVCSHSAEWPILNSCKTVVRNCQGHITHCCLWELSLLMLLCIMHGHFPYP